MNREEAGEMEDELLRIKAAELLGWVCVGSDDPHSAIWMSHPWVDPRGTGCRDIPDFPNDIVAAMILWEKLLELGYTVELFSYRQGVYSCVVGRIDDECHRYLPDANADTAARAITKAFVLAMEKSEKEVGDESQ